MTDDSDGLVAVIDPNDVLTHLSGDANGNGAAEAEAAAIEAAAMEKEATHVQPG
ncbi:MAG TPA: hypothetical protein GX686_08720 [Paracoccus sp.]|nr:hypothetical protein [Paracoccus sp. (in: a-proteobacteria)]